MADRRLSKDESYTSGPVSTSSPMFQKSRTRLGSQSLGTHRGFNQGARSTISKDSGPQNIFKSPKGTSNFMSSITTGVLRISETMKNSD